MLIIFGIRAALELLGTPTYRCEVCGNSAPHQVFKERKKFTLFFLPLFTFGSPRYFDVCSVCGRTVALSQAQAEAARIPAAPAPPTPQDAPTWTPQDRR